MVLSRFVAISFFIVLLLPVSKAQQNEQKKTGKHNSRLATKLFQNLKRYSQKGCLIGHQDDLAYGVDWKQKDGENRSDVNETAGDYPAMYGWDLGGIEIDSPVNLDSVSFHKMQQWIRQAYNSGGIITISWHLRNPLNGKSAWDAESGTVASILPFGEKHNLYKSWLDKVANFLNQLNTNNGELIPVIFRPFHELNGNWFWWGEKHCSVEEFKALWQFTINYLRTKKKLTNLLIAYNTDRFHSTEEYLQKYPGNEWVDIIGFDIYQRNSSNEIFSVELNHMLTMLEEMATKNNKLPALTEFGGNMEDATWWTTVFLPVLLKHKISYALAWRNAGKKTSGEMEYYMPYKAHPAVADFALFCQHPKIFFQKDIYKKKLYK